MKYEYEFIKYSEELPIKAFITGIENINYHWHNDLELILVLEGSIEISVEDKNYKLLKGELLLINSCSVHRIYKTDVQNTLLIFQFDASLCSKLYPDITKLYFKFDLYLQNEEGEYLAHIVRSYVAKIIRVIKERSETYILETYSLLYGMITYMLKNYKLKKLSGTNILYNQENLNRLIRILTYVNENYCEKINIGQLANKEHLSTTYFSHFVKDMIGVSLQTYITQLRIEKARKMLIFTDENISNISEKCGFSELKIFSQQFKRYYTLTPSKFREKNCFMNKEARDLFIKIKEQAGQKGYFSVNADSVVETIFSYI